MSDDYEYYKALFQYIPTDNKGHYRTVHLKDSFGDLDVSDFVRQKWGQTYRDIDPVRFWGALAWYGFGEAVGMSSNDVNKHVLENMKIQCKDRIAKLEEELKAKRRELAQLEMESE